MGLLKKLFEERATLARPTSWLMDALNSTPTASGVSVTQETALRNPAVYRAVSLISSTVAQLPLKIYRRLPDYGKVEEKSHQLYGLLHDAPNPEMTSVDFREAVQSDLCLYGNAFVQVVRDDQGRVTQLWPLRSAWMTLTRDADRTLVYQYQTPDKRYEWRYNVLRPPVLHLRCFSADGIVGRSPITVARESIAAAIAADEYGARYWANNSVPNGVLQGPKNARLTAEAQQRLRDSWRASQEGLRNSHKVAVLEDGWQFSPLSVANRDAQWVEARQLGVVDVCRLYALPPWSLFDMTQGSTYNTVEQQSLDFMKEISVWLRRWESQIDKDLLGARRNGRRFFAAFTVEGLLRSDIQTRYQSYATARQWGWMSTNEIRVRENLNSLGPKGDVYLQPLNMVSAGQEPAPEPRNDDPITDEHSARLLALATGDVQ